MLNYTIELTLDELDELRLSVLEYKENIQNQLQYLNNDIECANYDWHKILCNRLSHKYQLLEEIYKKLLNAKLKI